MIKCPQPSRNSHHSSLISENAKRANQQIMDGVANSSNSKLFSGVLGRIDSSVFDAVNISFSSTPESVQREHDASGQGVEGLRIAAILALLSLITVVLAVLVAIVVRRRRACLRDTLHESSPIVPPKASTASVPQHSEPGYSTFEKQDEAWVAARAQWHAAVDTAQRLQTGMDQHVGMADIRDDGL